MSRKSFHLHCQRIEASRNMARYYTLAIDARAGKHDDASRHDREHLVVAAEWSGLGMLPPVRREGDLCHVAGLGPAGCYTLGAFRRTAVEQNHIWMLELRLVELCLDALVIVVIHTAGESDLGPGRDQHLGLGAAACGKESLESIIAAVMLASWPLSYSSVTAAHLRPAGLQRKIHAVANFQISDP